MQSIRIERTNGNIPRSLAGEDHISGLLFYGGKLPDGFAETKRIQAVSSIETAEKLGITSDAEDWTIRVLHYQLREIFNLNPAVSLYVGIFKASSGTPTFSEIKTMQNFAGGKLRQIGVWDGQTELSADNLIALQAVRTTLESQDKPLSIFYAPKIADVTAMPADLAGANKNGVSVVIGQDGSGTAAELYADEANKTNKYSVTGIGEAVGICSAASVHESIAWVEKFPTGIVVPAFGDGTLLRDLDTAVVEALDASRYLFFVNYDGLSGAYFNDSHTMDAPTSDYAYIENVRTMDKACRGVRTYVLPKLGRPLKVEALTGKLETYVVEDLQLTANKALEDMEKAGELSGYKVEIDPDQNILSTSTVEMVIRPVGVGVMRKVNIKIGYAVSV